jgi:hypothetical protein
VGNFSVNILRVFTLSKDPFGCGNSEGVRMRRMTVVENVVIRTILFLLSKLVEVLTSSLLLVVIPMRCLLSGIEVGLVYCLTYLILVVMRCGFWKPGVSSARRPLEMIVCDRFG